MKESEYRSYDDLPLFLNSETVAKEKLIQRAEEYAGGAI